MAGALTHIGIVIVGFLIIWLFSKKYYYGLAFGIGHLAPDIVDFCVLGIWMRSINLGDIMAHPWFDFLVRLGHTFWHWIIFGMLFLLIIGILERYKKISEKTNMKWVLILIYFLIGVAVHLIIDVLIIETNPWI